MTTEHAPESAMDAGPAPIIDVDGQTSPSSEVPGAD
jgi:hypothetical protein